MKAYFARAMDGVAPDLVLAQDEQLVSRLSTIPISLVNPYDATDCRRPVVAGITELVEQDLAVLSQSDLLIADLSLKNRAYVGAIFEIARAFQLGLPIYVWVGDTGNHQSLWLKYHATAICRTMDDVVRLLSVEHNEHAARRRREELIQYYDSVADTYDSYANTGHALMNETHQTQYCHEREILQNWAAQLPLHGTVVDLGSGTGRFASLWTSSPW